MDYLRIVEPNISRRFEIEERPLGITEYIPTKLIMTCDLSFRKDTAV